MDYIVTITIRYRVPAATRAEAETAVRTKIQVPMDAAPGMLLDFALRAKEDAEEATP